jgi:methylated-DNA-[protein]-cysteine S-methyltransferase
MNEKQRTKNHWLQDGEWAIKADQVTEALDSIYLNSPTPAETKRALEQVAEELRSREAETLYYDILRETPLGDMFIAVTGQGIVALGFDDHEQAFLLRMRKRYRVNLTRSPKRVQPVARQLKDYFGGRRHEFDLQLDLRRLSNFQRLVLSAIQEVPPGQTISYGGLARRIGKPQAARAVGQALGSNPIPIIIPCHRALAADGSLGGYSGRGGTRTKQVLLELEGAY